MDELAAAAGLSRPGLYFHFPTKERLFTAALERQTEALLAASQAALVRADGTLETRLFAAFEALHPKELDFDLEGTMHELLDAAASNGPDVVEKLRADFVRAMAAALRDAAADAAWKPRAASGSATAAR